MDTDADGSSPLCGQEPHPGRQPDPLCGRYRTRAAKSPAKGPQSQSPGPGLRQLLLFRPSGESSVSYAKQALRRLARRYQTLDTEIAELDVEIRRLCAKTNPALLAAHGVGPDSAAALLIAAGDNPERMKSERSFAALCALSPVQASSGRTVRHRLNLGRQPASQQRTLADALPPGCVPTLPPKNT